MQTFQISHADEPRQFFLVDPLLLIPSLTCQAEVRLNTQGAAVVSVDPLLLVPLASCPTEPGAFAFHLGRPSFPHSSRIGPPAPTTGARPRAYAHSLMSWTHFYSFHLIDEGVFAALRSTRHARVTYPSARGGTGNREAPQRGGLALLTARPTS